MTAAMELLYLVAFLLLTRPGVTFGDNSEQRVVVMEGSDVVLPCSINNKELNYQLFEWKEGQKEVFTYDAGIHSNNDRGGQDPQFKGRVSHFEDELRNGNASIKIRNTKLEDSGDYSCVFPRLQNQIFHIELVVGPDSQSGSEMPWWGWLILVIGVVITFAALWFWLVLRKLRPCGPSHIRVFVKEGSDVVLPCSPGNLDLTKRVFIWKKGEQKVFLYAEGKIENGGPLGQDQQFRGRVSHFGGQLHLGNASITIHNTKVEDSGIYTCKFPGLGPLQTFSVKLIVVSADSEAASKVDDEAVPLSTKGPRDDRVV